MLLLATNLVWDRQNPILATIFIRIVSTQMGWWVVRTAISPFSMNLGISPEPRISFTKQRMSSVLCPLLSSAKSSWILFAGIPPSQSRAFPFGSPFNFLPYLLLQLDLLSESSILDFWHFSSHGAQMTFCPAWKICFLCTWIHTVQL